MTEIELSGQEPDASNPDHQPTADTGREDGETVHEAANWRLSVRVDGSVEARDTTDPDGLTPWTTGDTDVPARMNHRVGLSVEQLLARYAHETRFDRDPNEGEHGAALRDGIIDAICATATDATCGSRECDQRAAYVLHVNAPTGPSTSVVCDECASTGTYTTLHALENNCEQEGEGQ